MVGGKLKFDQINWG